MDKSEVIVKARRLAALERLRLTAMLGREPSEQEVHDAVREECISWCESWFSESERALAEDARRALALSWLQECGVLSVIEEAAPSASPVQA